MVCDFECAVSTGVFELSTLAVIESTVERDKQPLNHNARVRLCNFVSGICRQDRRNNHDHVKNDVGHKYYAWNLSEAYLNVAYAHTGSLTVGQKYTITVPSSFELQIPSFK